MGDGRYYTLYQFGSVLFLTLMMILICVSGVVCAYQGFKQEGRKILAAHVVLGIAGAMRFTEEVIVSQDIGFAMKLGELICLTLTQLLLLGQLSRLSRLNPWIYKGICILSGILLPIFLLAQDWLIQTYSFEGIVFGKGYLALAGIYGIFSVWAAISGKLRPWILTLYTLPLAVHVLTALFFPLYGDISLLVVYLTALAGLNVFSADLKAYRIGDQMFSNINDLIKDAVLVCDPENYIVYQNQNARNTEFIETAGNIIPGGRPEALLARDMTRSRQYNIQVFTPEKDRYMDCHSKTIWQGIKPAGQMIIFSDISEHIRMLDHRAAQKKEFETVNQKLRQYSNIVFDMEKEKEISLLLSDITGTQQTFMDEFRKRVKALSQDLDGGQDRFNQEVDAILSRAKSNLTHIRNIVAKYRSYYGPEN